MLERILYWADYFGLDLGDDFTVVSIVSDPEPYWVYAPTAAPVAAPVTTTAAPAPAPVVPVPEPGSSSKMKSSDGLDAGVMVAVVVVLLIIAALVYFKSRESEATARKDS